MAADELQWQWVRFHELTTEELYDILRERQQAFVVEYQSPNLDADGVDKECYHLSLWGSVEGQRDLRAYLRVVPPGTVYAEPAIGRVVTPSRWRGQGYGKRIMLEALRRIRLLYPATAIRISAQLHYAGFYGALGFSSVGESYIEEGIPHVQMLRPADPSAADFKS